MKRPVFTSKTPHPFIGKLNRVMRAALVSGIKLPAQLEKAADIQPQQARASAR